MSIELSFNHLERTDGVAEQVEDSMKDLIKITEDKFPFHVHLSQENGNQYNVTINCTFQGKPLAAKSNAENLVKALNKATDAMRTQVLKKAEKMRND